MLSYPFTAHAQPGINCLRPGPSTSRHRQVPGTSPSTENRRGKTSQPSGNLANCLPMPQKGDYPPPKAVPNRWRIVKKLGYRQHWYDPYHRNILKGDTPVIGNDWFFSLKALSNTTYESRQLPTAVGVETTRHSNELDTLGGDSQFQVVQNLATEFEFYKGDTVFRPPDYEFRFEPVFNYNHTEAEETLALNANPSKGHVRDDGFVGIQAASVDVHLRNVSPHYDFDSLRVGIQAFNADFRGFLFRDSPLGVRLFGTRDNNIFQYNLAWFRRFDKDINSGLNNITELRNDDIFLANLYWQDAIVKGDTIQFTALYNRNRDTGFFYDRNGFLERPSSFGGEHSTQYDVGYLGFNTNGHFGRINLTTSFYYAIGHQKNAPFTGKDADIGAFFAAAEVSFDQNWIRWRASMLYGSADNNPYDNQETGFDAVNENPLFAGADTSYWIRQSVPFIGGGRVALSTRDGVLNSLRSSKANGQSNFTNPGILLLGLGGDFDVLPQLRVSFNANELLFNNTSVLEAARQQAHIGKEIGQDLSTAIIYRPLMTQNIVLRASYALLIPGNGFKALYGSGTQRSVVLNAELKY